ncbi:Ribonuclease H domain [Dillenia turbinata]|uniref:Ribonuclease H domain n=1 Tax=Dillenia turbinata TaxID=194707 RepID=A0AAN8VR29_9MAGN
MVEILGLSVGLRIVKKKSMRDLVIETDSEILANALNKGTTINHPLKVLLEECRRLMNEVNALDMLAKLGLKASPKVHEYLFPPVDLGPILSEEVKSCVHPLVLCSPVSS